MSKTQPKDKHYVEFIFPGILFAETSIEESNHRDPKKVKLPKGCYAFRFFDRTEIKQGKELLTGKPKNYSCNYFPGGTILTYADVKKKMPGEKILISNMECNRWNSVIKTRAGNIVNFEKGDTII